MEKLAENAAGEGVPGPVAKTNRGWFRPGDGRINREGRPRGSKAACQQQGQHAYLAPYTGRLQLLFFPKKDFLHRLSHGDAIWVVNLPDDWKIIACRIDAAQNAFALTIWSQLFPRIAKGTPIPEFRPVWNGLRWKVR